MKRPQSKVEGISIREFARRDGCSERLVRRHVDRGAITKFPDGSIDPTFVGTGWRSSARRQGRADRPADTSEKLKPVRTKLSAFVAPIEATTFAIAADAWAMDLAVILLRQGIPKEAAQGICAAWLAAARQGAVDCLKDVPAPPGCGSWAEHPLFTAPWPNASSGTWADFEAEAAVL
ncbi:hypothetical protein [Acidisoma silvae]|uniref:Uncharacterized protein n=1 Tax=Acidisoma silvae TaxID=2802396 RepID=A0A963YUZ6_9PROT|nr:hypothetical protein [Acidisoma silvae]MCB8877597.1 hypothetical protein [Acidisoma silvae]